MNMKLEEIEEIKEMKMVLGLGLDNWEDVILLVQVGKVWGGVRLDRGVGQRGCIKNFVLYIFILDVYYIFRWSIKIGLLIEDLEFRVQLGINMEGMFFI